MFVSVDEVAVLPARVRESNSSDDGAFVMYIYIAPPFSALHPVSVESESVNPPDVLDVSETEIAPPLPFGAEHEAKERFV